MGRRKKGSPPAYRLHKRSGLAYCTLAGRMIYLGEYGSRESRIAYRRVIKEWEETEATAEKPPLKVRRGGTVAELVAAFLDHARQEYRIDGELTSTYHLFRPALREFLAAYGDHLADDLRGPDMLAVRSKMLASGLSRRTVNSYLGMVRLIFAWGKDRGLVEATTLVAVSVKRLPLGRTEEGSPSAVLDVPEEHVLAVAAEVSEKIGAMLKIQNVVGMRPGELCRMRGREINREGKVFVQGRTIQLREKNGQVARCWVFQPSRHKNRARGKSLAYILGPRARLLLTPWLPADPEQYLFPGVRVPWTRLWTYNCAIAKACKRLGVPHFSANRIRHAVATRYDELAGVLLASKIMGHANPNTTLGYVHSRLQEVSETVEKYG